MQALASWHWFHSQITPSADKQHCLQCLLYRILIVYLFNQWARSVQWTSVDKGNSASDVCLLVKHTYKYNLLINAWFVFSSGKYALTRSNSVSSVCRMRTNPIMSIGPILGQRRPLIHQPLANGTASHKEIKRTNSDGQFYQVAHNLHSSSKNTNIIISCQVGPTMEISLLQIDLWGWHSR